MVPFALLDYADVRKRVGQIAQVTKSRYMPPWQPEHGYGDFAPERRLSDEQIEIIQRWVQGERSKAMFRLCRPCPSGATDGSSENPTLSFGCHNATPSDRTAPMCSVIS